MDKQECDRLRYLKNREHVLAKKKVQYIENREVILTRSKISQHKRVDKIRAYKQLRNSIPANRVKKLLDGARSRAKAKKLLFDINENDILSALSGCCPYTGVPFDLKPSPKGKNPWAPSIDQIIPGNGYIRGNVEVVSVWWNTAKNSWPEATNKLALQGLARKAWPWQ